MILLVLSDDILINISSYLVQYRYNGFRIVEMNQKSFTSWRNFLNCCKYSYESNFRQRTIHFNLTIEYSLQYCLSSLFRERILSQINCEMRQVSLTLLAIPENFRFEEVRSIHSLCMMGNLSIDIPLPSLSYLKLCQSNLTKLLPSLQSVSSSLLGFNCVYLTSEILPCLYSFHNLQELECKISHSNELNLSFFPNLRKLCLISFSYKLFPQGLDTCKYLKELYLEKMKCNSHHLIQINHIKRVDLNKIQYIDQDLSPLNCIQYLTLNELQLKQPLKKYFQLNQFALKTKKLTLKNFSGVRSINWNQLSVLSYLTDLTLIYVHYESEASSPPQQITLNAPNLRRVIFEYSVSNLSILEVKYELRLLRLIGNMRLKEIIYYHNIYRLEMKSLPQSGFTIKPIGNASLSFVEWL